MTALTHLFVCLAILSFPLYLFSSGGLQISHVFFGGFLLLFGNHALNVRQRLPVSVRRAFAALGLFVVYVCAVQLVNAASYQDSEFLVYGAFYVFNFLYLYVMAVYLHVYGRRASQVVFLGTAGAIGVAFYGAIIGYAGGGTRQSSFFNNPNQLGYFGVVSLALVLAFHTSHMFRYSRAISLAAVAAAAYLCTVSLSKAAMIAAVLSIVLFIPLFSRRELAILVSAFVFTSPLWMAKVAESTQYENAVRRLEHVGQDHDDNLSSRGYARIARFPKQLFLGAGEGRFIRFGSTLEIHATFANILFSYGVPGALLLTVYLLRTFRIDPQLFLIVFTPSFAYGLTHNGIRSSFFWLLMAVFFSVAANSRRQRNERGLRRSFNDTYGTLRASGPTALLAGRVK